MISFNVPFCNTLWYNDGLVNKFLTGVDHETNKSNLYFIVQHPHGEQVHPPG